LNVTHDALDTEDIVQEIYLDIVRCLPFFRAICSPGHWIDYISCKTIRTFFYSELRKTSPTIEKLPGNSPIRSAK
jgi:DNA-directed RNA polymerase specialized sigma24 family protein